MVKIVVHKFAVPDEKFCEKILDIINDCYDSLPARAVEIVDLYVFDKASTMNAFLNEEKRRFGIKTAPFDSSFFATHDAWLGTPRIMVSHDGMAVLPEMVRIGGLHHEVGHTVLHGSLEYYSFPFPELLLRLEKEGVVSRQIAVNILYLASIAVKDYEVTRLLYENGYVEDQVAFNKYLLEPSEEDCEAWNLAKQDNAARLLVLVSLLKPACCAAPLLKDGRHGEEIAECIDRSMGFLPKKLSVRLPRILNTASEFGGNTHENVDRFLRKVIEELA